MIKHSASRNDHDVRLRLIFSFLENRTIVRQDERPAYFYIVLSGSAIPTCRRDTDSNVETLKVLKRGSTFGVRTSSTHIDISFSCL